MDQHRRRLRFSRTVRSTKIVAWIGKTCLRLIGWRTEGNLPDLPKYIVIGAHHTSNWDSFIMIAAGLYWSHRFYWMGKESLFTKPWGFILKWLGGVPIKRDSRHNAVDQAVDAFNAHEQFVMVISPEGTRKAGPHWKTGFYYIAQGAQVPIACAFVDYKRKVVGVGPELLYPSGDIEADFEFFREFYASVTPKFPDQKGEVAIRPRELEER